MQPAHPVYALIRRKLDLKCTAVAGAYRVPDGVSDRVNERLRGSALPVRQQADQSPLARHKGGE